MPKKPTVTDTAASLYLNAASVRARFAGVSHMWLVRRLASDPTFPRPVKFGQLRYWKISELEAWEATQAAAA